MYTNKPKKIFLCNRKNKNATIELNKKIKIKMSYIEEIYEYCE